MARYTVRGESIVSGLLGLCLLTAGAVTGCSAADPPPEVEETKAQDPLLIDGFCGGRNNVPCNSSSVCSTVFNAGCPDQGAVGLCIARPRVCPQFVDPVCGCDGRTYDNLCKAAQSGAAIVHLGACAAPPKCDVNGVDCPGAGDCVPDNSRGLPWWFPLPSAHPGTCECNATQTCASGQRFNDDPLVCACQANPDACNNVACPRGQECVANNGTPACVPDPCNGVACRNGQVCIVTPDHMPACMPNTCSGVVCRNGEQCMVASDGSPSCMPNACAMIACKNGQSCVIQSDGTAACR